MHVADTLKIIVIWILCESSIEECPSKIVYNILLTFNSTHDNFSIDMIMEKVI